MHSHLINDHPPAAAVLLRHEGYEVFDIRYPLKRKPAKKPIVIWYDDEAGEDALKQ